MKERNRFYEELVGGSIVGVWLVDDTLVIHLFDDRQICVRGGARLRFFQVESNYNGRKGEYNHEKETD